jgi:hypothetical protein
MVQEFEIMSDIFQILKITKSTEQSLSMNIAVSQAVKEFPTIYGTPMFLTASTRFSSGSRIHWTSVPPAFNRWK